MSASGDISECDRSTTWVVVKVVDAGGDKIIGCVVGPFFDRARAEDYGEKAGRYALGYERWIVRELQKPNDL